MHAFLISDGHRPGSHDLASVLSEVFELEILPPVFVSRTDLEDENLVNVQHFRAFHLRPPTQGEIGCALAHRGAYQQMIVRNLGEAAIFEDDAQVGDAHRLSHRIGLYTDLLSQSVPTLINLNQEALPKLLERRVPSLTGIFAAMTHPYPATAYVINLATARNFVYAQTPVQSQADWPRTTQRTYFYVDRLSSVIENTSLESTIDEQGQRPGIPLRRKLAMWTALWFRQHHDAFPTFKYFLYWLPGARIVHHGDRLLRKIKDKVTPLSRNRDKNLRYDS